MTRFVPSHHLQLAVPPGSAAASVLRERLVPSSLGIVGIFGDFCCLLFPPVA